MSLVRRLLGDESGATATEYGLIAASMALAVSAAVKGVSNNLKSTFNNVATNLRQARLIPKRCYRQRACTAARRERPHLHPNRAGAKRIALGVVQQSAIFCR